MMNADNNETVLMDETKSDFNEITLVGHDKPLLEKSNKESFYNGLYCLYRNHLTEAKIFLVKAVNGTEKLNPFYWKSLSFLGLVEVLLHKSNGGLYRCYEAAKECTNDPEMHLNIAYAEYRLGNRKRCVYALKTCLDNDPYNKQARYFFNCIGQRNRNKGLINVFGKFLRRKNSICSGEKFNQIIQKYLSIKLDQYVEKTIQQP